MRRTILITLLGLALVPAETGAVEDRFVQGTTVITTKGAVAQPYQSWVYRAKVPTPLGTVTISHARCPGVVAWACAELHTSTLFMPKHSGHRILMHELGHIFDHQQTAEVRWRFLNIMGYEPSWWQGSPPAGELFADAYAECARGGRSYETIYGYEPSRRQHRAVCRLIRSL